MKKVMLGIIACVLSISDVRGMDVLNSVISDASWLVSAVKQEQVPGFDAESKVMAGIRREIASIFSPYCDSFPGDIEPVVIEQNYGFVLGMTIGIQEYLRWCVAAEILEQDKKLEEDMAKMKKIQKDVGLLMFFPLIEKIKKGSPIELTKIDKFAISSFLEESTNASYFSLMNRSVITAIITEIGNAEAGEGTFLKALMVMRDDKQVIDTFYMLYAMAQARGKIEDFVRTILNLGNDIVNPETYYLAMVKCLCSWLDNGEMTKIRDYYKGLYDYYFLQCVAVSGDF